MNSRLRIAFAATSILFLTVWSLPAHAEGNMTVKTGYLTCHEASGWGFIIGSSRDLKCSYTSNGGRTEYYTGSVSKFGADIGYLKSAVILWAVAAPTKMTSASVRSSANTCRSASDDKPAEAPSRWAAPSTLATKLARSHGPGG